MSITYPLTFPTHTGLRSLQIEPRTVVGVNMSQFTGDRQVQPWPGQWLVFSVELPPMKQADAALWAAFFMSLNGPEGTFLLGPSVRKTSAGTIAGTVTVGAGATANSTTLPLSGGTGAFAVGDWLQVGTAAASRLHRVLKVNAGSVDVFPRLRTAYANGTAITYSSPKGLFSLVSGIPGEAYDSRKICKGINFTAIEVVP